MRESWIVESHGYSYCNNVTVFSYVSLTITFLIQINKNLICSPFGRCFHNKSSRWFHLKKNVICKQWPTHRLLLVLAFQLHIHCTLYPYPPGDTLNCYYFSDTTPRFAWFHSVDRSVVALTFENLNLPSFCYLESCWCPLCQRGDMLKKLITRKTTRLNSIRCSDHNFFRHPTI